MLKHIEIKTHAGRLWFTKAEWLKLPRLKRIESMVGGHIAFLNSSGQNVPAIRAISHLHADGWLT